LYCLGKKPCSLYKLPIMLGGMSQHEASYVLEVFSVVGLVMSNYNMFSLAGHSIVLSLS